MKRLILPLIAAALFVMGAQTYAAENVEIYIDGDKLDCETTPVNIDERVLVPMRAIFEALGVEVSWDGNARTVWAARSDEFMRLTVDSNVMNTGVYNSDGDTVWVDDIQLDVPARIINDYTYVPVRAVSETLGTTVSWDGENNRVVIDSRRNVDGTLYYSSNSDFQKLYAVGINGLDRHKLSDRSVYDLEMYDGDVYYLEKDSKYLYRANDETGEELVIGKAVNKIDIDDGWLYYQELDGSGRKSGVVYRINLSTMAIERLTDNSVKYPEKYRDYIYFNLENDNRLYNVTKDGTAVNIIDLGDSAVARLYPFNCMFFGDYMIVENGMWYGNIMRVNLDGTDVKTLTQSNSLICKNQERDNKIVYVNPDNGQDIYCVNIDGSDNRLVHEGDPSWLDIEVLAQCGDIIYYKNPMRSEVYRVNLDGSNDTYVCYADEIKVSDGRLFSSYQGLYTGSPDASDLTKIYDKDVKDFDVIGDTVYFTDKKSERLYMSDFIGRRNVITADSVGEWVCN
ncbi:MAG: stalk domain-containing protein [Hominilimicola sp.]